jgi:tetratricopeptide (TPR) repeat protein
VKIQFIILILANLFIGAVFGQSKIYAPKAKEYKVDSFAIDSARKAQGQSVSKEIDTSVEYDMDDLFNLDLTEAERAQAKAIIDVFTQQIKEDSTDVGAYINRGAYWSQLGLHVQAIKDYNKALSINPDQPIVYYNRALSKARFFYTYDACLDLKKAQDLGLTQAGKLMFTKCGRHLEKLMTEN